jgi:hypothetical protein
LQTAWQVAYASTDSGDVLILFPSFFMISPPLYLTEIKARDFFHFSVLLDESKYPPGKYKDSISD